MSEQINVPGLLDDAPKPLQCAVSVHGGQAVLHFSEPREFTGFTPQEAMMVGARMILAGVEADGAMAQTGITAAMATIDGIYELRGDMKPAGGAVKHELIERHRRTLTKRIELMLNTQRERKTTSNHGLAKQLVDAMLHEVFA